MMCMGGEAIPLKSVVLNEISSDIEMDLVVVSRLHSQLHGKRLSCDWKNSSIFL